MRKNEIILHHKLHLKLKWRIMDINEKYLVTYDYMYMLYQNWHVHYSHSKPGFHPTYFLL